MLIQSTRLYERILLGLESEDTTTRNAAESCLSYFVLHMRNRLVVLPPELVEKLDLLPEET